MGLEPRFVAAKPEDAEALASIRVEAMRPSLEAVGRFDPERARQRFLSTFIAAETTVLTIGDQITGFFVVRDRGDHRYLDHLYLTATHQGLGLGRHVIAALKRQNRPIRLMALNGSPANGFYQSCGFRAVSSDNLDTQYEWMPE